MNDLKKNNLEVIAPNLNRRLSGVTSTIVRLVPLQSKQIGIRAFGVGLPIETPKVNIGQLLKSNNGSKSAVWHARRNVEMLLGLTLRHVFRKNYKLLFTSASQRKHSNYSKFLIGKMDRIVATSNATAAYLERPCDVVYHGINTSDFLPISGSEKNDLKKSLGLPDKRLIGCFGRIRKQKGTDVFVDAMIRVLADHPQWSALIMGRATEQHLGFQKELEQKIENAGLSDRIIFGGEAPVDKIASYYQALDLFVAPQRWEGFGLTPLEAMACGVPVVATKVGAFPEIIREGETGNLIETANIDQMVSAVTHLVENAKTLNAFSKASRKLMTEEFDIQVEAEKLIKIYREMIGD